jgi:hypothetical protein
MYLRKKHLAISNLSKINGLANPDTRADGFVTPGQASEWRLPISGNLVRITGVFRRIREQPKCGVPAPNAGLRQLA